MEHVHRVISRSRVLDGKGTVVANVCVNIWDASESSGLPWNVVRGVFEGSSKSLSNPSTPPWLPRVSHASTSTRSCREPLQYPAKWIHRERETLFSDVSFLFFFYLPTTSPHVTSPFVNGRIPRKVVARIFCMKPPFSLSDRFFVKDVLDFYSYKSLTQFSSFMHLKCLCRFF